MHRQTASCGCVRPSAFEHEKARREESFLRGDRAAFSTDYASQDRSTALERGVLHQAYHRERDWAEGDQGDVDEEESARCWSWLLRRPPFIASSTMAGVFSRNAFAALVRLLCPAPSHPPRPPTSSVRRGENELAASRPGARPRRALASRPWGGASRHTRMLTCV